MSKDYFTKIQFNKEEENKPKVSRFPAKHEWSPALDEIWEEISILQRGGSRFFKEAVTYKTNTPALAALHRFAESPTRENYKSLVDVLPQDFGPAGNYFVQLLNKILEKANE